MLHANRRASIAPATSYARSESLEPRRLLSAGALDRAFADNGKLTIPGDGDLFNSGVSQILLQQDGKLLVAGSANNATHEEDGVSGDRLLRFNSDGTPDASFTAAAALSGIALAGDGKIVGIIGGKIERLKSNGNLDTTFGSHGAVVVANHFVNDLSLAVASNGKIAIGFDDGGATIQQFNSNGASDTGFGKKGMVRITDFGLKNFVFRQLLAQPDGKLLLLGSKGDGQLGYGDFEIIRLTASGALDKTFGKNGVLIGDFGHSEELSNGIIQPDGKIVVTGDYVDPDNSTGSLIARYNANGTLDLGFGDKGARLNPTGEEFDSFALALQPDGRIVALEGGAELNPFALVGLGVLRLNPDGSDDQSFGDHGLAFVPVPTSDVFFIAGESVAVDSHHRIYLAGTFSDEHGDTSSANIFDIKSTNQPASFASPSAHGTLRITGTAGDDAIGVVIDGGNVVALCNSQMLTFNASDVKRILIDAGAGNDRVTNHSPRRSTILGGAGLDTVDGGEAPDSIDGGAGADSIRGLNGPDTIDGGAGNDDITGGRGDDLLIGDAGNDSLDGEDGTDTLRGGTGDNNLFDSGYYDNGRIAQDTVDYSDLSVPISLNSGNIQHGSHTDSDIVNFRSLIATRFNDSLHLVSTVGSALIFVELHGGAGDDTIFGDDSGDSLFGDDGNDSIVAGGGKDLLDGGSGDDTLHGGAGNDTLRGGTGRDRLFGDAGDDLLLAKRGSKDILDGGDGSDIAYADLTDIVKNVESVIN